MNFGSCIRVPSPQLDYAFDLVKKFEKFGFDSFFYPDHTIMLLPSPGNCYDAFSFLSSLAVMTTKIKLCTGVSDCHRFHPAFMAHKIATLDRISKGRAMFGVGAGEAMNIDAYGLNRKNSIEKLREYIDLIRAFLTKKKKVSKKSRFWGDIRDAYIQIKPIQKRIPIYIAGNGPKTRQITGESGDGWYPYMESPRSYEENKKEVVNAAKKAGRSPESIDYVYLCSIAIDNANPENAIKTCESLKLSYVLNPTKINQIYPKFDVPTNHTLFNFNMQEERFEDFLDILNQLPETILQDTNCLGTTDDAIASIERFTEAGATHLVFENRGPDENKVYKILKETILPYFKDRDK